MADSTIAFTDTTGAAVLSNGRTGVFSRFWGVRPVSQSVGPKDTILGTQRVVAFEFARVRGVYLEIRRIPNSAADVCDRFKLHMETGGSATLNTGDGTHGPYTVSLMPGTEVEVAEMDERKMELVVRVTMMNTTLGTPILIQYPV